MSPLQVPEKGLAPVLELPQVDFLLTVRKVGLQTLSILEAEKLLSDILTMIRLHTMKSDYQVTARVQFDGVMTLTNA